MSVYATQIFGFLLQKYCCDGLPQGHMLGGKPSPVWWGQDQSVLLGPTIFSSIKSQLQNLPCGCTGTLRLH